MNTFKKMRILSGKTRQTVANETGFGYQAITAWELGRNCPTPDKLPVLAKAYRCSVADLLEPYETK